VVLKVHSETVEAIRNSRTSWAAACVLGAEHEVIDEELRTSSKEIG
jgi:hypothetical protein